MTDKIEEIKKRVMHPDATTLSIRRVRKQDVEEFKSLADKEFLGDYGMAFKELMDSYNLIKCLKDKFIESEVHEIIIAEKKKVISL